MNDVPGFEPTVWWLYSQLLVTNRRHQAAVYIHVYCFCPVVFTVSHCVCSLFGVQHLTWRGSWKWHFRMLLAWKKPVWMGEACSESSLPCCWSQPSIQTGLFSSTHPISSCILTHNRVFCFPNTRTTPTISTSLDACLARFQPTNHLLLCFYLMSFVLHLWWRIMGIIHIRVNTHISRNFCHMI